MKLLNKTKKQGAKKLKDSRETHQSFIGKLSQREQQLSIIVDTIPGLVSHVDNNLRYLYASKGYERLFGIPPEKVVGRTMKEILGETVFERVEPYIKRVLSGEQVKFENPIKMPNGEISYNLVTYTPYVDQDGNIKGFIIVVIDITERKLIEKALEEEANRRHILMEQSRDGIVILDQNGKVYESNRKFAEMLGYSLEEIRQLHVWDWDARWSKEQLLQMVQSMDASGDHFETIHRRKDGTLYDVEISTNGAEIGGQKLIFCICRDISERKAYEKRIIVERAYFEQLFQNAPEAIVVGDINGKISLINAEFTKLFGYTQEEAVGKFIDELIVPEYLRDEGLYITQKVAKGEKVEIETRRQNKEGKEIDVSLRCQPIFIDNTIVEVYGIYYDITGRKKVEIEIKKRIKELEDFYEMAVGRELRMIELKEQIENLKEQLSKYKQYIND